MYQSDSQPPVAMNDTPDSPHARESDESILRRARERANGERDIQAAPDETLQWVHDSWISDCEAAGVYSRTAPAYEYSEAPAVTVSLVAAELRLLAQRHLNTAKGWAEFYAWNGLAEELFAERAMIHEARFRALADLLPAEEQERFQRQIEIRNRYIASVRSEVARCERAEQNFWERVEEGLIDEAEIAAHRTPPFIAGLPGMPAPADGGPGPEEWDLFF
jgi:hypothetical protein